MMWMEEINYQSIELIGASIGKSGFELKGKR